MRQSAVNFFLVILFLYAALDKVISYEGFINSLLKTTYLQLEILPVIGIVLPAIELLAVILLLHPNKRGYGLYLSLFLMISFTIHLTLLWQFSPGTPCSCGGLFDFMNFPSHLAFNLVIITIIMYGIHQEVQSENHEAV